MAHWLYQQESLADEMMPQDKEAYMTSSYTGVKVVGKAAKGSSYLSLVKSGFSQSVLLHMASADKFQSGGIADNETGLLHG